MRKSTPAWLIVCLVVLSATAPVAAQQSSADVTVDDLTYAGDGTVAGYDETLYLWNDSSHEFTTALTANGSFDGEVCLVAVPDGSNRTRGLACSGASVATNETATNVTVTLDRWPDNATGEHEIRALLRPTNASDAVDSRTLSAVIVRRSGDRDGDGLTNEREAALGTDLDDEDTDGDGLDDDAEVTQYETAPTNSDTDGDGIDDGAEVDDHETDPTTADSDGDGLPDAAELDHETNPTKEDSDGDGLDDGAEVTVHQTDPTNPDTDGDGLADGTEVTEYETDPTDPDTDSDGLGDALEVTNYDTDPTSVDTDGDGLEDGEEVNEHQTDPTAVDTDDDGLNDGQEVKTFGTKPNAPDTDDDGLEDGPEVYEYETDPNERDSDDDGVLDGQEVDQGLLSRVANPIAVLGGVGLALSLAVGLGLFVRSDREWSIPGLDDRIQAVVVALQVDTREHDRSAHGGTDDTGDGPDAGAGAAETADAPATEEVPPEFMSNEQRVLSLLAERDGRMDQSDIVDETGWSKSKVSRVLSEMEDEGQIVKIDVGAGNVVTVPENVPPGVQSPLDR